MEHRVIEEFNKEAFIEEVEKRPTIWNIGSPEYSNRILKKQAWLELVDIFIHPEASHKKKILFGEILQRKWKSLKDTYIKEYKKIKNAASTSNGQQTSNYIYFSKLSFLQKCVDDKEAKFNADKQTNDLVKSPFRIGCERSTSSKLFKFDLSHLEAPTPSISWETDDSDNCTISETDRSKRPFYSQLNGALTKVRRLLNGQDDDEDDKMFCMSLYKELIKVPEKCRLDTKIELLRVLRRAQADNGFPFQTFIDTRENFSDEAEKVTSNWYNPTIQPVAQGGITLPITMQSSASSMESSFSSNCSIDFESTFDA